MGLYTKGLLSTWVFKLHSNLSLEDVAEAIRDAPYPSGAREKATQGWGSFSDDPYYAAKESVAATYSGTAPQVTVNHNNSRLIRARYYYDRVDPALVRRFGDSVSWTSTHERHAFDVLFLEEGEPNELTALVSTRTDAQLDHDVIPVLQGLVAEATPAGQVNGASITEELDPDFFLWLVYRLDTGGHVHPTLSISEITSMKTDNIVGRSRFNEGAGSDRPDMMILIASRSGKLGPAKVSFTHTAKPEGYFELELAKDGGFVVLRDSSYDEDDLQDLPPSDAGLRMVEDMWQVVLPKLRSAYALDHDWRAFERDEFIENSRTTIVDGLKR